MFANFSFNPSSTPHHQPQSQSEYEYPAVTYDALSPTRTASLSPTSSRSTSPSRLPRYEYSHLRPTKTPIHLSVTELSHKLSAYTLNLPPHHFHPPQRHHASSTPTPSPPGEHDDDTFFELDRSRPRAVEREARTEASCRRRQRQYHSRLQCDPHHLKALADLVEGMVKAGKQCFVYESPGLVSRQQEEEEREVEEEDQDDDASDDGTSTRSLGRKRSVEWAKDRTCISKSVKVRREGARRGRKLVRRPER